MARVRPRLIRLLEAKGLHVVAVQNPLTALGEGVAATRNAPSHWRMVP